MPRRIRTLIGHPPKPLLQCSQFLWLQIKILRCASLRLIRSSVKWSCDFLGGINPPICYTQPNCCVGRVILCKMPYGRQMLWKMCFACIWSRSKPVNPAITTLQSLHCVHYMPSPITQNLNWTGCSWSCTYILGLVFCEEVMLGLLSCVNLYLLWVWTDTFWPCMAMYFWFPYQCYLRQTQSCFSRRPSYLREKFKNIPFSWVHPVWGIVEEVHWRQVSTSFSISAGTLQLNNRANWMSLIGYSLGKANLVLRTGICWKSSNLNHLT